MSVDASTCCVAYLVRASVVNARLDYSHALINVQLLHTVRRQRSSSLHICDDDERSLLLQQTYTIDEYKYVNSVISTNQKSSLLSI